MAAASVARPHPLTRDPAQPPTPTARFLRQPPHAPGAPGPSAATRSGPGRSGAVPVDTALTAHPEKPNEPGAPAGWRRGYAADCKSVKTGSIPVPASKAFHRLTQLCALHQGQRSTGGRRETSSGHVSVMRRMRDGRPLLGRPSCHSPETAGTFPSQYVVTMAVKSENLRLIC